MDQSNLIVGVIIGVVLSAIATLWLGAWFHESTSAKDTCNDRGGVLTYSARTAACGDGTVWVWREGYIVPKTLGAGRGVGHLPSQ